MKPIDTKPPATAPADLERRSWFHDEPSAFTALGEASRLWKRAVRRPFRILLFGILTGAAAFGFMVLREHLYAPRFILRAVETDYNAATAPRAKRRFREYLTSAVFTHRRLLQVIEKHGLYRKLMAFNAPAAVDSFRQNMDIDVYQNYFVEERRTFRDAPRSARISIRFRSEDPGEALAVARELGQLVIDTEKASRRKLAEQTRAAAKRELVRVSEAVVQHRNELARVTRDWATSSGADEAMLAVRLIELQASLQRLEHQLQVAEQRSAAIDVSAIMDQHGMGLHFEVVDDGVIADGAAERQERALIASIIAFVFGLPLVALGVGAFDPRIRRVEDLNRLGVPVLGHVTLSPMRGTT